MVDLRIVHQVGINNMQGDDAPAIGMSRSDSEVFRTARPGRAVTS
jgi:hypothetical protein